ncbi:MAG: glutamate-5-semialdehyde dehydrogenase [Verrucomicrobiota bacterium]
MPSKQDQLKKHLKDIAVKAKEASRSLADAGTDQKNKLLQEIANKLESKESRQAIAEANAKDLELGEKAKLSHALLDRLELNKKRMTSMVQGVQRLIELPDPVGEVIKGWEQSQGVQLQKVRVPIGVIGIIFESRPNVTVDASTLCLKTGNVTILRGGKEAFYSNQALGKLIGEAAKACGFPQEVVTVLPTTDREAVPILCEMHEQIDLMIPRGGHGLIKKVVEHSRMPVIKHYDGICHVYVHQDAVLKMAREIVLNAKLQRPGVCNAMETLLIDATVAKKLGKKLIDALLEKGVELFADRQTNKALETKFKAPSSWSTEYLDLKAGLRVVEGLDQAIAHIEKYGSHHSDTIVTENEQAAETFLQKVDSAAVYWNVSTRFTDGAAFGFGAEIGISTDKIHARGPMALEELTSYKYVGRGKGQIIKSG